MLSKWHRYKKKSILWSPNIRTTLGCNCWLTILPNSASHDLPLLLQCVWHGTILLLFFDTSKGDLGFVCCPKIDRLPREPNLFDHWVYSTGEKSQMAGIQESFLFNVRMSFHRPIFSIWLIIYILFDPCARFTFGSCQERNNNQLQSVKLPVRRQSQLLCDKSWMKMSFCVIFISVVTG